MKNLSSSRIPSGDDWRNGHLTAHDWNLLFTKSTIEVFEPGTTIIKQSKALPVAYVTESGIVRIQRNGERTIILRELREPGFLLGEHTLFVDNAVSHFEVRAETRATLRRLNVPFLLQYFQSNPQLAFRFCSTLGRQFARNFRISSINLELYDLRFASTHTVTGISQKPLVNTPRILTDFFPFLIDSLILYGNINDFMDFNQPTHPFWDR